MSPTWYASAWCRSRCKANWARGFQGARPVPGAWQGIGRGTRSAVEARIRPRTAGKATLAALFRSRRLPLGLGACPQPDTLVKAGHQLSLEPIQRLAPREAGLRGP